MSRAVAATLGTFAIFAAALFVPAGRLDWAMAWAYLGLFGVVAAAGFALLDPELIRERARPAPGFDRVDAVLSSAAALALLVLPLVVAGLDVGRSGGRSSLPPALRAAALAVFAIGQVVAVWAAHTNRFFSDFVRIQTERGHHVVDTGPYAFVRHPGYAASIPAYAAVPVLLGSAWGLLPALVGAAIFVLRTAREDRTLHEKLPGYREYAARVRWRLLPGVW
jgi:protein-S-isoprenylcysteine O-methyltransferase Ste14